MKSILFLIFIIISFSVISSKRLRASDIFKRSKSHPTNAQNLQIRKEPIRIIKCTGPPITNYPNAAPRSILKPRKY